MCHHFSSQGNPIHYYNIYLNIRNSVYNGVNPPPNLHAVSGRNMFNSVCDYKALLHQFLRWWIRKLFVHCIWVSTVYIENVNMLWSTLVLTSWSQAELSSLSEPEYLCILSYMIKFCEWYANICETLSPCDLHKHDSVSVLTGCVLSCDSLVMRVGHLPAAQSLWQWDLVYLDGLPVILGEYWVWNTGGGKHRAVTNISSLV